MPIPPARTMFNSASIEHAHTFRQDSSVEPTAFSPTRWRTSTTAMPTSPSPANHHHHRHLHTLPSPPPPPPPPKHSAIPISYDTNITTLSSTTLLPSPPPVPISPGLSPSLRHVLPHPKPLRPNPKSLPTHSDLSVASTRAELEPTALRDLRRVTAPTNMLDPSLYMDYQSVSNSNPNSISISASASNSNLTIPHISISNIPTHLNCASSSSSVPSPNNNNSSNSNNNNTNGNTNKTPVPPPPPPRPSLSKVLAHTIKDGGAPSTATTTAPDNATATTTTEILDNGTPIFSFNSHSRHINNSNSNNKSTGTGTVEHHAKKLLSSSILSRSLIKSSNHNPDERERDRRKFKRNTSASSSGFQNINLGGAPLTERRMSEGNFANSSRRRLSRERLDNGVFAGNRSRRYSQSRESRANLPFSSSTAATAHQKLVNGSKKVKNWLFPSSIPAPPSPSPSSSSSASSAKPNANAAQLKGKSKQKIKQKQKNNKAALSLSIPDRLRDIDVDEETGEMVNKNPDRAGTPLHGRSAYVFRNERHPVDDPVPAALRRKSLDDGARLRNRGRNRRGHGNGLVHEHSHTGSGGLFKLVGLSDEYDDDDDYDDELGLNEHDDERDDEEWMQQSTSEWRERINRKLTVAIHHHGELRTASASSSSEQPMAQIDEDHHDRDSDGYGDEVADNNQGNAKNVHERDTDLETETFMDSTNAVHAVEDQMRPGNEVRIDGELESPPENLNHSEKDNGVGNERPYDGERCAAEDIFAKFEGTGTGNANNDMKGIGGGPIVLNTTINTTTSSTLSTNNTNNHMNANLNMNNYNAGTHLNSSGSVTQQQHYHQQARSPNAGSPASNLHASGSGGSGSGIGSSVSSGGVGHAKVNRNRRGHSLTHLAENNPDKELARRNTIHRPSTMPPVQPTLHSGQLDTQQLHQQQQHIVGSARVKVQKYDKMKRHSNIMNKPNIIRSSSSSNNGNGNSSIQPSIGERKGKRFNVVGNATANSSASGNGNGRASLRDDVSVISALTHESEENGGADIAHAAHRRYHYSHNATRQEGDADTDAVDGLGGDTEGGEGVGIKMRLRSMSEAAGVHRRLSLVQTKTKVMSVWERFTGKNRSKRPRPPQPQPHPHDLYNDEQQQQQRQFHQLYDHDDSGGATTTGRQLKSPWRRFLSPSDQQQHHAHAHAHGAGAYGVTNRP